MGLIRRAVALTAATAMAALVTAAASACGGASTATGTTTNGLEKKSPADVLQAAAAALEAAKSVHVVGTVTGTCRSGAGGTVGQPRALNSAVSRRGLSQRSTPSRSARKLSRPAGSAG